MTTPHAVIENELESFLAGRQVSADFHKHLEGCPGCRDEVSLFRHQASLLRSLRVSEDEIWQEEIAPAPGFYARVMEQIEAVEEQASPSIWTIFLQPFGQRLAFASLALFVVLSGVLLTVDNDAPATQTAQGASGTALFADQETVPTVSATHRVTGNNTEADRDAVLTQLVAFDQ
jgi:hypothetical protein